MMNTQPAPVSARCLRTVLLVDILVLLLIAGCASLLIGCAQTAYKATTHNPATGITTTRSLTATSFLVNRDLGKLTLGDDSLEGAKSDQTSAIEALASIASKGGVKP